MQTATIASVISEGIVKGEIPKTIVCYYHFEEKYLKITLQKKHHKVQVTGMEVKEFRKVGIDLSEIPEVQDKFAIPHSLSFSLSDPRYISNKHWSF